MTISYGKCYLVGKKVKGLGSKGGGLALSRVDKKFYCKVIRKKGPKEFGPSLFVVDVLMVKPPGVITTETKLLEQNLIYRSRTCPPVKDVMMHKQNQKRISASGNMENGSRLRKFISARNEMKRNVTNLVISLAVCQFNSDLY